jgi:hypothetical protein
MKNYFKIFFVFMILSMPVYAFEDCIITTDGKLTDIKIQHNDIINVYPLITVDNDKNTLIIEPLKAGETKFTVLKNNKDKYLFNVNVTEDKTTVEVVEGFGILSIDTPPNIQEEDFELDEPPVEKTIFDYQKQLEESKRYQEYIDSLEEPPELRGEE